MYTGKIVQQSLAKLFNSRWHDCWTVTGRIIQQWLAWSFNSHWHNCSTVSGTIIQQSLARLINSAWHDSSTVTGIILQQSLAGLFNSHGQIFLFSMLAEFFNSEDHCWRIVPCTRNTVHDPYGEIVHLDINYAIWLAESILANILGTRFFPNIGFVQKHSK